LFKSGLSLSKIKDAALDSRLFSPAPDGLGVPGRSLAWKVPTLRIAFPYLKLNRITFAFEKLFLTPHEPLLQSSEWNLSPDLSSLQRSRKRFSDLLLDKMRAPDGSYEEGLVVPGMDPPRRDTLPYDLEMNNPLSLHDEV
jgi:TBC1 domain family protein 5